MKAYVPPVRQLGGKRDDAHAPLVGNLVVRPHAGVQLDANRGDFLLRAQLVVQHALVSIHQSVHRGARQLLCARPG